MSHRDSHIAMKDPPRRRRPDNPDMEKHGDKSSAKFVTRSSTTRASFAQRGQLVVQRVVLIMRSMTRKHLFLLALLCCGLVVMHQNNIILGHRGLIVKKATNLSRLISQSQFYLHFWTFISPGAAASWQKAKDYYDKQRPLFEKAAQEFEVHPYWLKTKINRIDAGWYEMITLRAKAMYEQYKGEGKEDFRIEKDKCEMYRFFNRNKFRTAKIHGIWDNVDKFSDELFADKAIPPNSSWPIFFKCCHLTQGSSESTRMLKSYEWLHKNEKQMRKFVKEKWIYRADDWERPWANYMNPLTDSLKPGILLQGPYKLSYDDMAKENKVVELKVECFWGRAYLASANFGRDTIVLRDGSIEVYPTNWQSRVNAHTESPWNTWIREEGHLEKVWKLAETAAKIMGIDQVRIDIFIKKGDPDAITINENSISSGMGYRSHFEFMPKIWAEGHVKKWYKEYKGASANLPVYMQDYTKRACPNVNLINSPPPYV